jgi:hypothetical protein
MLDDASQKRYILVMKTATLPSIRVEPQLRTELESVLKDSETLSEFVENAVRESLNKRRNQAEFMARGLASLHNARSSQDWIDSDNMLRKLSKQLDSVRKIQASR